MIKVDLSGVKTFLDQDELKQEDAVRRATQALLTGSGAGSTHIGWVDLPEVYDRDEFKRIKSTADRIRGESDVLLVIGVGGSYLAPVPLSTCCAPPTTIS